MPVQSTSRRLPAWFKVRLSTNERYSSVRSLVRERDLRTVCESAACPNRNECWNAGTATFLILGDVCTRRCGFCNIPSGCPAEPDRGEPERVADAVASLGLSYVVVTSVTRDDLPDGGAGLFADTIKAIRKRTPHCRVEVLVPDFQGSPQPLDTVLDASPHVLNHNIETVPSLYPRVRPQADYGRSLQLLRRAKDRCAITKSGIMLGLGEGGDEVRSVLRDLRSAGCDMVTLGQYLQPSREHLSVQRYYRPEEFGSLRSFALDLGFRDVAAGPLVRSSYRAALPINHAE
ncbi:MAG: lipoyl synthase [Nitrospirae bacterium]|nr:lipoyl synthase [Nitrospirota bacterium]